MPGENNNPVLLLGLFEGKILLKRGVKTEGEKNGVSWFFNIAGVFVINVFELFQGESVISMEKCVLEGVE